MGGEPVEVVADVAGAISGGVSFRTAGGGAVTFGAAEGEEEEAAGEERPTGNHGQLQPIVACRRVVVYPVPAGGI